MNQFAASYLTENIGLELVEGFPLKLNDFVLIIELVNKTISGKVVYQIVLIGSSLCFGSRGEIDLFLACISVNVIL